MDESPESISDLVEQAFADHVADRPSEALMRLHADAGRPVVEAGLRLMASEDEDRRVLGTVILRELGSTAHGPPDRPRPYWEETLPALLELASSDPEPYVRAQAVVAVGFVGAPQALPALIELSWDEDPAVREMVADALTSCQPGEDVLDVVVLEPLIRLAGDDVTDVRWSALWELANNGPDLPEVRSALTAGAKSEAENVRAISLEGLARLDGVR
jgi:hypothetical protein